MGDTVYFGSCSGVYHALDASTGDVRWEHDFNETVGLVTFHGDPLVTDRVLITGLDALEPAESRAFDIETGEVVWEHYRTLAFTRSDVVGLGRLAVGRNETGELVSVDAATGAEAFTITDVLDAYPFDFEESPAATEHDVAYSATDGTVRLLDATGRTEWIVSVECDVTTSMVRDGDDLYVGCVEGRLLKLSRGTGAIVAEIELERPVRGRLLLDDERVVVPGGAKWIGAVGRDLAGVEWERDDLDSLSVVQPFAVGDVVLTGGKDLLIALDRATGETRWTRALRGRVRGIGHSAGRLFVGTIDGVLYAYREIPADGE